MYNRANAMYESERGVHMSIRLDLKAPHSIVNANSHYYRQPTEQMYLNRVLPIHDLVYMVEGEWAIAEDEVEHPLRAGDVLLLAAQRHHYTRLPCKAGTRTICIHVSCAPGDGGQGAVELPTLLHMQGNSRVKQYFEEMVSAFWQDDPMKEARLSALFTLLMLELAQNSPQPREESLAQRAMELINATPHRRLSLKEAAEQLYVSSRTLENAMRRQNGMGFSACQLSRRLEMAALQMIVEPDIRLKEIAANFGFCDEFHFSKAFKQKYGLSPQQYREKK